MNEINCPVCQGPIDVRAAKGRKSGKPFVMLICAEDGRHFRAFITDQDYVSRVFDDVQNLKPAGRVRGRVGG